MFEPFHSLIFRGEGDRLVIFRWDPVGTQKITPVVCRVSQEKALEILAHFLTSGQIPDGWSLVNYAGPYKRPRGGMQEVPPDRLVISSEGVCEMSGVASVRDVTALISRLLN